MTNTLSISISDTSGGNVSEMEGTKGYTTSSATSGYTFVGGEYITLAVTGKGVTSRPTTEIMKQYTVASGSATGGKLPVSGTFTKPTSGNNFGSWAVASEATQSTHWGVITPKAETAATGYDYTYSAVAIPGGPTEYAAGGKLINITIGSETFSYEVPAGGITLAAGKQYNYDITVKNQTINVETVITDWNDVADAHTSYIPPAQRLPPMPPSSKTVNTIKQPILFTSTTQG